MVKGQNLNFAILAERIELLMVLGLKEFEAIEQDNSVDGEKRNTFFDKNMTYIKRAITQAGWDYSTVDSNEFLK